MSIRVSECDRSLCNFTSDNGRMEGGEGERCLVGTFMPCHAGAFFLVAALPSPLLGTRRAREDRHTEREACSSELSSELEAGLFCAWCGHRAVSGDVGIWTYRHAYRSFCVRRGFPRVAVLSTRVSHWRARRAGRFGKKRSKQNKERHTQTPVQERTWQKDVAACSSSSSVKKQERD